MCGRGRGGGGAATAGVVGAAPSRCIAPICPVYESQESRACIVQRAWRQPRALDSAARLIGLLSMHHVVIRTLQRLGVVRIVEYRPCARPRRKQTQERK